MATELNPIAVVFALHREAMFFRRQQRRRRLRGAPCPAVFYEAEGSSVVVLQTGMGADGVIQVLEWLFRAAAQFRPALVISAGFCGALVPDAVVGDLVLGTEVLDLQGRAWSVSPAPEFRGGLQGVRLHHGRLLSVPAVVTEPAEKRRLGDQRAALAVDMETAAVAEFCTRLAVPFACLRAISDNYDTHLSPQLHGLLQSDRVSTLRVLLALIRRPAMIGELCRLARDSRLAARHLAQGLEQLLPSCQVALR